MFLINTFYNENKAKTKVRASACKAKFVKIPSIINTY